MPATCMWGGQRKACQKKKKSSLLSLWVPGIEPGSLGLSAGSFTCWVISPALNHMQRWVNLFVIRGSFSHELYPQLPMADVTKLQLRILILSCGCKSLRCLHGHMHPPLASSSEWIPGSRVAVEPLSLSKRLVMNKRMSNGPLAALCNVTCM